MNGRAKAILHFWFNETKYNERFEKNKAFDQKIRANFFEDYQKAANNEYDNWQDNTNECLALIILLDQFSRNIFRNNSKAFAMDTKARNIAKKAVEQEYHKKLTQDQIMFLFLPFMHSEKLSDQIYCVTLINSYFKDHAGYEEAIKYAQIHKDIIKIFGRFPHRNKVLKRISTKKEKEFLKSNYYDFFNI